MKCGDVVRLVRATPRSMVSKVYHANIKERVGSSCGMVVHAGVSENWVTVLFSKGKINLFPALLEVIIDYEDKTVTHE